MSSVIFSRCDVAVADVGVWRARVYILSSAADEITDKVTDKVTAENTAEAAPKTRAHENPRASRARACQRSRSRRSTSVRPHTLEFGDSRGLNIYICIYIYIYMYQVLEGRP